MVDIQEQQPSPPANNNYNQGPSLGIFPIHDYSLRSKRSRFDLIRSNSISVIPIEIPSSPCQHTCEIIPVDRANIDHLRALNLLLFPVRYSERFYKTIMETTTAMSANEVGLAVDENIDSMAKYGYLVKFKDSFIGVVAFRLEPLEQESQQSSQVPSKQPKDSDSLTTWERITNIFSQEAKDESTKKSFQVYLISLGVLAPFRRLGLGSLLLKWVINYCTKVKWPKLNIQKLVLHVQSANEAAIRFYQKHQFEILQYMEDYYSKVECTSAYLMQLKFVAQNN